MLFIQRATAPTSVFIAAREVGATLSHLAQPIQRLRPAGFSHLAGAR
jgi:hypothetical protein